MSLEWQEQEETQPTLASDGVRFAGMCLATNATMAALKIAVGLLAGSHALLANALYSINDVCSSIALAVSLKIGIRKPDEEHPYGYGKAEYIAIGMVSLIIAIGVFFMFFFSVLDILSGVPGPPHFAALSLAGISLVVSWFLSRKGHLLAEDLQSPALDTTAEHHHADAVGSMAAIIGIAGAVAGLHVLDRLIAVFETLHLIALSGSLLGRSVKGLMDISMAPEDIEMVEAACAKMKDVLSVGSIRSRRLGSQAWVDVAVEVPQELSVVEAHRVSTDVADAVRSVLGKQVVAQVRCFGSGFVETHPGPGGSSHG